MKTGLVLEGGALRTIFSAGVCDAFLDAGIPLPDYTVGVSAGIAYGVSYLSQQSRRNLKLLTTFANDRRYMGWKNLINPKNRSYFGLKFSYETIPNDLLPFDYDTFEAYPGTVEAVVTNLDTGKADYLPVPRRDAHNQLLQATCAIPMMFPVFHIDGNPYLDGGCADPIPWRRALEAGCDHLVVILTRERTYRKEADRRLGMLDRSFRKYPKFLETMHHRADAYNESREALFALEAEGKALVIAPEDTLGCTRTERDMEVLRALWQSGYFAGRRAAEEVRTLWSEGPVL
ncbi:patatin family protein [Oscillibacter sp.]|uniref:patatin-like phospholipase family protein n=1 Tax=Oscillibacter sp. TaxID=1945593 RepID=UPI002636F134|nr:patatin family protein [Oscillibacter sp.]MDD3346833.1 patatin family protein [Oscillibacter sp.]